MALMKGENLDMAKGMFDDIDRQKYIDSLNKISKKGNADFHKAEKESCKELAREVPNDGFIQMETDDNELFTRIDKLTWEANEIWNNANKLK